MIIGTAIFYFIIIGANALENKIIRLSQNGISELSVPFILSDEEGPVEILSFSDDDLDNLRNELIKIDNVDAVSYSFRSTVKKSGKEYTIIGLDFDTGISLFDFEENFSKYNYNKLPSNNYKTSDDYDFEGAVGSAFARQLNVEINNRTENYEDIIGEVITFNDQLGKPHKIKITGIIYTDVSLIKGSSVVVNINVIEKMNLGVPTKNILEIRTKNKLKSNLLKPKVEPLIKERLDEKLTVYDWREDNPLIINLVYAERISLVMIQLLTAFAISIGIMNVLFIGVKSKTSQIGIIKAIGLKNSKTVNIFIIQTILISIFSIILGLLFGYYLTIIFQQLFTSNDGLPLIPMNKHIFNRYTYITFSALFSFSILGSILPLISVKNMKIIEIITSE